MTATQVQAKKPAAKAASKKPAAKPEKAVQAAQEPVKSAGKKAAAAVVQFLDMRLAKGSPVYSIAIDARPTSGQRLAAQTHAALTVMGMLEPERPAVPKSLILALMGQTAVTYHTRERNIESAPNNMLRLSIAGRNKFVNRLAEGKVNAELSNAFVELFTKGKALEITGIAQAQVFAATTA